MRKKLIMVGALVLLALVLFAVSLVIAVRLTGGLPASQAARVPALAGLTGVRQEAAGTASAAAEPGQSAPGDREAAFLRFSQEARLASLANELQVKQVEHEEAMRELQRRSRELDAWERQLKEERDTLREQFVGEKEEIVRLREDLARREAELAARQVAISQAEEANLKKTAEIYGKMEPAKAAEVLSGMYKGGQQNTVVKIVYLMPDRNAAKMLEAIQDASVSAEITAKISQIARTPEQGG